MARPGGAREPQTAQPADCCLCGGPHDEAWRGLGDLLLAEGPPGRRCAAPFNLASGPPDSSFGAPCTEPHAAARRGLPARAAAQPRTVCECAPGISLPTAPPRTRAALPPCTVSWATTAHAPRTQAPSAPTPDSRRRAAPRQSAPAQSAATAAPPCPASGAAACGARRSHAAAGSTTPVRGSRRRTAAACSSRARASWWPVGCTTQQSARPGTAASSSSQGCGERAAGSGGQRGDLAGLAQSACASGLDCAGVPPQALWTGAARLSAPAPHRSLALPCGLATAQARGLRRRRPRA
jgi:hypothetical protein